MERVRVAVVGAGYWGPNVVRTLLSLPQCELAAVCDRQPGRLRYMAERFPGVTLTDSYDDLLADASLDAVALVTPVSTHRALGLAALEAGKHLLVEKPLAATVADAEALVRSADQMGKILATGHVFAHHPAVASLRAEAQKGSLGRLCYASSERINSGPPASEVDVIWDLAVHDAAILISIIGREPSEVSAHGYRYVHPSLLDVAFLRLDFGDGLVSHHHVSWLSPMKIRRFFVAGTDGSALFDDTGLGPTLVFSDQGEDSRRDLQDTDSHDLYYRPGELRSPELPDELPLTVEWADFIDCVRTGRVPLADGHAGLSVVRILESAEQSIQRGGAPVSLAASDLPPARAS